MRERIREQLQHLQEHHTMDTLPVALISINRGERKTVMEQRTICASERLAVARSENSLLLLRLFPRGGLSYNVCRTNFEEFISL